jgi:F-type H+-transporting ATPase subunit b
MQQLLSQLGIDWRLLLAQAVNFFLLLVVLRIYVYKPLLKLMHDRRARIEEGLMKADEAERRLHEVDEIGIHKIKAAETEALGILKKTENEARELEAKMLAEAKRKEGEALKNTESLLRAKEEESRRASEKEAASLVRRAIAKTVELAPAAIDDSLITKAVAEAAKANVAR